MKVKRIVKDWALPLSMVTGALSYFVCRSLPLEPLVREQLRESIPYVQPTLIFCMLTLTFCRIKPSDMRLRGWQGWLLLFQAGTAALFCLLHQSVRDETVRLLLQSTMLCFLCPTATAAAVVTTKLGGNAGTLTAYTLLINLCAALLFPTFIPLVNPTDDMNFWLSFRLIVCRVFPLLIFPLLVAFFIRHAFPRLLHYLTAIPDLPFYIWTVSLSLAIAVTTRIIVHADVTFTACLVIALGSALACALQFAAGRMVGRHYGDNISAAQACGQKNTVLAIWVGYTFLHPLTALAGGFYSIWHNVYNSYQLYRKARPVGSPRNDN